MGGMTHSMAYIKAGSLGLLETLPGAKLDIGGKARTPVRDHNVLGYSETIKPGTVECEIALKQGTSLATIAAITDATVTYEADTGQTYVIRNAFATETLSLTAGEGGKVAVKFAGDPAQEMGV